MKLKELNPMRGPHVMHGEGTLKMLNDTDNESLLIMFREAVQNSWDARIAKEGGIDFEVKGYKLSSDNISILSQMLIDSEYGSKVIKKLNSENHVIEISDLGTHGLTGPIGYDFESESVQQRYLKFVYDIGNSQESEKAGGSYGYGKTSFYRLSKIGLNAIYSRVKTTDGFESRLIFKCINRSEKISSHNIGVYWWGKDIETLDRPGSPFWMTPLTNEEADKVWNSIGGSAFKSHQTGTKVIVFCPDFFNDDLKPEFVEDPSWSLILLSRYAVHLFWAKWPNAESDGINFKFIDKFDGENKVLHLDDPSVIKPYSDLIRCLEVCKSESDKDTTIHKGFISSGSPKQKLGRLCIKFVNSSSIKSQYARFWKDHNVQIALMRNVEFVLKYHVPGVSLQLINEEDDNKHLIGVYRTLDDCYARRYSNDDELIDLNEIYRASEDPTHGKWVSTNVQEIGPWCVTYIRRTLPEIDKFVRGVVLDLEPEKKETTVDAGVELMTMLGGPISGMVSGGGTSPISKNGSGSYTGSGRESAKVNIPDYEVLDFKRIETDKGSIINVNLKISDAEINTLYEIAPYCNDENGNFKIKFNGKHNISLPVKIIGIHSDNSSISQLTVDESGSAIFELTETTCEVTVQLELLGECSFILKIKS